MYFVPIKNIHIPPGRQRKEFDPDKIVELGDSIVKNGLIHAIVVRGNAQTLENLQDGDVITTDVELVAGERRLRAFQNIWGMGEKFSYEDLNISEGYVPCTLLSDLTDLEAKEIELEENIKRQDLTWQERAKATSDLLALREAQAKTSGAPIPNAGTIAEELEVPRDAARTDILVAQHLNDPDVAKAATAKDALKILKRKEEGKKNIALGQSLGTAYVAASHRLLKGDCVSLMDGMAENSFDVILTDPPYGMDAQDFNDSGGRTTGGHFYDDSLANWISLMGSFAEQSFRVAKVEAHAYVFCDIDNFTALKALMKSAGWDVFRTPIIWHNPTAMRAPWPEHGPHRKYQLCLYAMKGKKRVNQLFPDLVTYPSDENIGHPAQKPVALYQDLLKRSIKPGDSVLDPFCGSGTIFPAAHGMKVIATGIEMDEGAYGLAAKRLGELK